MGANADDRLDRNIECARQFVDGGAVVRPSDEEHPCRVERHDLARRIVSAAGTEDDPTRKLVVGEVQ